MRSAATSSVRRPGAVRSERHGTSTCARDLDRSVVERQATASAHALEATTALAVPGSFSPDGLALGGDAVSSAPVTRSTRSSVRPARCGPSPMLAGSGRSGLLAGRHRGSPSATAIGRDRWPASTARKRSASSRSLVGRRLGGGRGVTRTPGRPETGPSWDPSGERHRLHHAERPAGARLLGLARATRDRGQCRRHLPDDGAHRRSRGICSRRRLAARARSRAPVAIACRGSVSSLIAARTRAR